MDTLVIALKDFSLTSYELESQSCEILICLALCCTPNGKEMRTAARLFEIWMADAEAIHNSLPDKTWKIPLACLKVHFYESVYARKSDNTIFIIICWLCFAAEQHIRLVIRTKQPSRYSKQSIRSARSLRKAGAF